MTEETRPGTALEEPRSMLLDILILDGGSSDTQSVVEKVREAGYAATLVDERDAVFESIATRRFDVIIADVLTPRCDGLDLLRRLRSQSPAGSPDVILIASSGEVREAVTALKEGARDYLARPIDHDEMLLRLRRIGERRAIQRELAEAREALSREQTGPIVLGRSPSMTRLNHLIETFANSDAPVLVHGQSGTGKELVAKRIHVLSARKGHPFVAVNCAAFPDTLLEAELFGHERGAFTGAMQKRDGRFKTADHGTLFLDEVAELPPAAQAKLLRVLQEGIFEPLGTNTSVKVDVRLISATHRDLKERISEGRFREDLYFRLKVLSLELAPLRERRVDFPLLAEHFLRRFTPAGQEPPGISPRAWAALYEYPFPGNVRELEHALQHACVLSRTRGSKELELEDLPRELVAAAASEPSTGEPFRPLRLVVREFEREYLLQALKATAGRKARAARLLGVSRKALWKKLTAYGIATKRTNKAGAHPGLPEPSGPERPPAPM
jgi:two-component system, NtrC family, response regulator AtoC